MIKIANRQIFIFFFNLKIETWDHRIWAGLYVTEMKYLGLTVRERLNFNHHLVKEKLSKSVAAVKRVLRVD